MVLSKFTKKIDFKRQVIKITSLFMLSLLISSILLSNISTTQASQTVFNFAYSPEFQEFTAPRKGLYKISLWGASGGDFTRVGGYGSYTEGYIDLSKGQSLYVYTGQSGDALTTETFNGGGASATNARSGGGATDIRLTAGDWNSFESLKSRIMVAAGGGGASGWNSATIGGNGGALYGYNGNFHRASGSSVYTIATGGTQIQGGTGGVGAANVIGQNGVFGTGGNSHPSYGGGGGGGYYGGGGASYNSNVVGSGGGGSSFISGHIGNNAIADESTDTDIIHTDNSIHYSGIKFFNTRMIDGGGNLLFAGALVPINMPKPDGTFYNNSIGHDGNGFAKIEFIEDSSNITNNEYNIGDTVTFGTIATHTFVAPANGVYKAELWGARGGYGRRNNATTYLYGPGAYTGGDIYLNKGDILYVYVGGAGGNGSGCTGGAAGWNGGARGGNDSNCDPQPDSGGGSGGATDIRLVSGAWNNFESLKSRIMVAGGGGGSNYSGVGGAGGVFSGLAGVNNTAVGTQTGGHAFGFGGNGAVCTDGGGGGGGGYYGGTGGSTCGRGGAGGSSYISTLGIIGYEEDFNAVGEDAISTDRRHTGQPIHYSGKVFENAIGYSGNELMPNTAGTGTMTGNAGNGFAKITIVSLDSTTSDLESITLSSGSLDKPFDSETYEYNVVLAPDEFNIDISATTKEDTTEVVSGLGNFDFETGTTRHEIVSVSDSGEASVYVLNITRPASPYRYLNDLLINGFSINGFSPTTLNYTVPLSFDDEFVDISAIFGRPSQLISGTGIIPVGFGSTVAEIYVTSEDGSYTTVYRVTFQKSNSSKLRSLTIGNFRLEPDFDPEITEYEIAIQANTLSLSIDAIPFDASANVNIQGAGYIKNNVTTITITVTQANVSPTTYTIIASKEGAVEQTIYDYTCTNSPQEFIAPATGLYSFELWGAGGGYGRTHWTLRYRGGFGAYNYGEIFLHKDEVFHVYVGCGGVNSGTSTRFTGGAGGWNGGAAGGNDSNRDAQPEPGGGGGGATDIRLVSGTWNDFEGLKSRIMVAGGGGGGNFAGVGGAGGTIVGGAGVNNAILATQISGFSFGYGMVGGNCTDGSGGGAGGYYGGMSGTGCSRGGGGGSSFISGHPEVNSIAENSTQSNIIHTNQPVHYSGYQFQNIIMIDGNSSMPSPQSGFITGKSGHGHAKITLLPMPSENNFLSSIEINKGTLSPVFNMETYEYNVELGVNDTKLSIVAVPEDLTATVSGNRTYDIPAGTTTIDITVTAENGDIRVYTINATRPASSDSKPNGIVISGLVPSLCAINESYCSLSNDFSSDIHTYYMTVPSRIKDLEFTVIKSHDYQDVVGEGIFNLVGGENVVSIVITSEDGSSYDTYVYYIERDMTGNTDLDSLVIYDPEREINFDPGITEYFIAIPNEYSSIGLTAIPSDERVTPIISGNENFEVGLNTIEIYMEAINGEEKTYVINVYREQSGNTFLSNLEVVSEGVSFPFTPTFNKILNSFTVTVPNNITDVDIIAAPEVITTTVSGAGNKILNTGTNQFVIGTTAEDGSLSSYTINIIRQRSNNTNLATLGISEAELNPNFTPSNTEYDIVVEPHIKSLSILATTESPTSTFVISGNNNFKPGVNTVNITVTAEDGSKKTYVLSVTKLISENNNLAILNTDVVDISDVFDKDILEYNLNVSNEISSIVITAIAEDSLAKVTGAGRYNLQTGTNIIYIDVVSESGDVKSYIINIDREYNSNANLSNIYNNIEAILTPDFDPDVTDYLINVQNEIDSISITGVAESNTSSVVGNGIYNLNTGDNFITLLVTSESGNIKTYNITVVRDKSINDDLLFLFVHEGALTPGFNETIISYDVHVANTVTNVTIDVETEDPNATYEIIGNDNLQIGDNTVIVRVTAEAGEDYTKDYIINIIRQPINTGSNNLLSLSVNKGVLTPVFTPEVLVYEVELEHIDTTIEVTGALEDSSATVTGFGVYNLEVGKNVIPIRVLSTDNIEKDYQIIVTRKKSNETRLSSLSVTSSTLAPSFSSNIFEYALSTFSSSLVMNIRTLDPNATYEIIGNDNFLIGSNTVIIRVTAHDGITKADYVLDVTREPSNNNNLSNILVTGGSLVPTFNKSITLYNIDVDNDVNTIILDAIPEDPTSIVENDGEISLVVGENIVEIIVTSASGKIKVYTVIVNREGSSNNNLSHLSVDNGVLSPLFDENITSYTVSVPYEIATIDVTAITDDFNATIIGDGIHNLSTGLNVINLDVRAENGSIKTYTVSVTRENIISSKLKSLNVAPYLLDIPFNSDITSYVVDVDFEIASLNLVAETLDPDATFQIVGNENFTVGINTVEIIVTSSNNVDTTTYTLSVNRQNQSNTYLAFISVSRGVLSPSFDKTNLVYSVLVPNDTSNIIIGAEPDVPSASVSGVGSYPLNYGDNIIHLVVTSSTGIKRTYSVNVIREMSSQNFIESLSVKRGVTIFPVDPVFDSSVNEYNVTVPTGTENIEIVTTFSENATIVGDGVKNVNVGENIFDIIVTSQSGSDNIYTVIITREPSDNNYLTDILPSVGDLEPEFSYFETEYTLRVDSSSSLLSFEVSTEDRFSMVTGEQRMTIPDGTSTRIISVTAENGDIREYTITVIKDRTDEARLSSLTFNGYTLNEPFDPDVYQYSVVVPNNKRNVLPTDIIAISVDSNAVVTKDDIINLSTASESIYNIVVTAADGFTIQTYQIFITRELGSVATLSQLSFSNGSLTAPFNPNVNQYLLKVSNNIDEITASMVTAIPTDSNATVVKQSILDMRVPGVKYYYIDVTSEDGSTTNQYVIEAEYSLSNNTKLSDIITSEGNLNPVFNSNTREYSVSILDTVSEIEINAVTQDENATIIDGVGTHVMDEPSKTIEIQVQAEDGSIGIYKLVINKSLTTNLNLLDISISGFDEDLCGFGECIIFPAFDPASTGYSVLFPNIIDYIDIIIEKQASSQIVRVYDMDNNQQVSPSGYLLNVGTTNLRIEVTNSILETKNYYLTLERLLSANNMLDSLEIVSPSIDFEFFPEVTEYFIEVENEVENILFEYETQDPDATVVIKNNFFLSEGNNDINITVTAPNGATRDYIVHVVRKSTYNNYLRSITVSSGQIYPLSPSFNKTIYSYSTTVGSNISTITLDAVVDDITTSLAGTGEKTLTTGNNSFTLTATAATGEIAIYNVNIIRQKATNVYLQSLSTTEGMLNEAFNRELTTYTMTISDDVNQLNISATPEDSSSTVNISGNANLKTGKNTITIMVISHDRTTSRTYRIIAEKLKSSNYLLSSLSLSHGTLTPDFTSNTFAYSTIVSHDVLSVDVFATPQDPNAHVTGTGTYALTYGNNTINVLVTAENGDSNIYSVNVYRSYDNNLIDIVTDRGAVTPVFDENITEYTLVVGNETENITVIGLKSNPAATISGNGFYSLTAGSNIINIIVSSTDGSSKTYRVNVVRSLSDNNLISYLSISEGILNPVFSPSHSEYEIMISNDYSSATFDIILDDPNASYEIIGNENLSLGDNPVTVRVSAEDGSLRDYNINIIKQPAELFSNKLISLSVNHGMLSPSFSPEINSYSVVVNNDINNITVNAVRESVDATVNGIGTHSLENGQNRIPIVITSKDGITRTYEVIVHRVHSSDARLLNLSISEGSLSPAFTSNTFNYTVTVPSNIFALTPTITPIISGTTYTIIGNENLQMGQNIVTIRTTSADGSNSLDYTIMVIKGASTNNNLLTLNSSSGEITPAFTKEHTGPYYLNIGSEINSIVLDGTLEDNNSTVAGLGLHQLDNGSTYIPIVVTSENGNIKTYIVIVNRDLSTEVTLTSLSISEGEMIPAFDPEVVNYSVNVPNEIDNVTVFATASRPELTVTGNHNWALEVGNNIVSVVVSDQNGAITTYTININREKLVSSKIKELVTYAGVLSPSFSSELTTYEISVPNDITELDLDILLEDPDATYEIYGNNHFAIGNNLVTIVVADSLNEETTTYYINASRQISTNNYLSSLTSNVGILDPAFNKFNLYYEINVSNNISEITISGVAEDGNSSVSGIGTHALQTGENLLPITVTSQTGLSRTYFIKATRALSDDNLLLDLTVTGGEVTPSFNPNTNSYNITVQSGVDNINFDGTSNGFIDGLGTFQVTDPLMEHSIIVTSESGAVNTYTFYIEKILSNDARILNITPDNGTLEPDYSEEIESYVLNVNDEVVLLNFEVETSSEFSTVSGHKNIILEYGSNVVVIVATAEDGVTTKEVLVTVNRYRALTDIVLSDEYIILAPEQTKEILIEPIPEDAGNLEFVWSSLDETIATVEEGIITAVNYGSTIITVTNTTNPNIYKIIAVNVISLQLMTDSYDLMRVSEEEDIVIGIVDQTEVTDFLQSFENPLEFLQIFDSAGFEIDDLSSYVGTGMILKLVIEGIEYDAARVIVRGDVDGNGIINIIDVAILENHVLFKDVLEGYVLYAMDLIEIGIINIADVAMLENYIIFKIETIN